MQTGYIHQRPSTLNTNNVEWGLNKSVTPNTLHPNTHARKHLKWERIKSGRPTKHHQQIMSGDN